MRLTAVRAAAVVLLCSTVVHAQAIPSGPVRLEINLKAGTDKDNKRVEKIFFMDQARTATVSQKFNFKQGITMRPITLTFNIAVE